MNLVLISVELVDCFKKNNNNKKDAYVAWISSTQVSIQMMYFKRKHARVLDLATINRSGTNLKKGTQDLLLSALVIL